MAAGLAVLDISKVNVAIPAIEASLGATPTAVQLIVAGYVLAFGLALVPAGRAGDLRGRRVLFLIGVVLFGLASVVCGFAPNVTILVIGRLLEGIAAGTLMPQALGLLQRLFAGAERGKAFGLFGAMIGLTLAIAPPLGGLLVTIGGAEWGWRLVFLMNVPIVAVLIPLAARLLPPDGVRRSARGDLDPVGILLLAMTTLAVMAPFALTTGTAADSPLRWLLLPVAAVSGTAFAFWERRYVRIGQNPVVDFGMFRSRGYRHGVLIALAYYGGAPASMLVTTLFLQLGLGVGALQAGLSIVPFAVAFIVASWWSGRLTHRYGRPLVIIGLSIAIVGWGSAGAAAVVLPADEAQWLVPLSLILAGWGAGCVSAPNQTLTLNDIPPSNGGLAGSITQVAQRLGAAIGVAVLVSAFYGTIAQESFALGNLTAYRDAYRNAILAAIGFFCTAVIIAVMDERWRRRHGIRPMTE